MGKLKSQFTSTLCKGTTHFRVHQGNSGCGCATLAVADSANATPVTFTDPSPHPLPHHIPCLLVTHLVAFAEFTCCTVPSHAYLAYVAVIPSRVFLRVFSLDFPLLGWVITSALQGCPYSRIHSLSEDRELYASTTIVKYGIEQSDSECSSSPLYIAPN